MQELQRETLDLSIHEYNSYKEKQPAFNWPEIMVTIDNKKQKYSQIEIEAQSENHKYKFVSLKPSDTELVYKYLFSQPLARQKYMTGLPADYQTTKNRVDSFIDKLQPNNKFYGYTGFMVYDENSNFLGLASLEPAVTGERGYAELSYIFRPDTWSTITRSELIVQYHIPEEDRLEGSYKGVGTVAAAVLIKYAEYLSSNGMLYDGEELLGVKATARLDNPGSWKVLAKLGLDLESIEANLQKYGDALRYTLRKLFSTEPRLKPR